MLPELHIFGTDISTYYMMMFLGFLLMTALMVRRRAQYDLNVYQAVLLSGCIMFSGVLGCKILYILENWGEPITLGGFSFFGAVFLVPIFMPLFGALFKLKPSQSINASAPCVCAMIGTIRVGCFLSGCCGGWALPNGFRFPTQAMESIGDFMILYWLLDSEEKGKQKLYLRFMLAYGILRFLVEFLRDTPKDWLGLSHGHWFAIAAGTVGAVALASGKKRGMGNV